MQLYENIAEIIDDEIKQLKDAKIIGAGTYVIDLKFRIESMEQFKDILGTAIYCK